MKLDSAWLVLLAIATGAACGVVAVSTSRRRRHRSARDRDDRSQIGAWEDEGGNVAPVVARADRDVTPTYRAATRPRFPNGPPHPKATPCDIT